ncbi:MAG: hypothetical protein GY765_28395 [bacterium]|nr:hypothetical protein [bacterium]
MCGLHLDPDLRNTLEEICNELGEQLPNDEMIKIKAGGFAIASCPCVPADLPPGKQ